MRAHGKAMIAVLCAPCVACAGANGDRIQLCEPSGTLADYAFVDATTGILWLSDMGLEILECGEAALCFSPAGRSFRVSQTVDGPVRRRNDFPWGYVEWRLDPATRELVLILDNQATKRRDMLRSCKPVPSQIA